MRADLIFIFTALVSCGVSSAQEVIEQSGTRYLTFRARPDEVQLFWLDKTGKPYRQFSKLKDALAADSKTVRFLMNAGIFEEGGIPSGLTVIGGKVLRPLNTKSGEGNFYLKPNGVFFVGSNGAAVVTTEEYAVTKFVPSLAVQSGPLLLRNGKIHDAFHADSPNRLLRNGVGVTTNGVVLFAIADAGQTKNPNLYEFAEFFRDNGCRDALYLDGVISQAIMDSHETLETEHQFGAIFAVFEFTGKQRL